MAMSKSRAGSWKDKTRLCRLFLVIIDELTPILRDLLHQEIDPNDIFNEVTQRSLKCLNKQQWHLICNASTDGYRKFDITLLYSLLRNVCPNIQPPTQNWGIFEMPSQNEITVGDDIERIRIIRNNLLGHIPEASIPEKEFLDYWSIIFDISNRMETLLKKDYVKQLLELKECPIDSDTQSKVMEVIKELTKEVKQEDEIIGVSENFLELRIHKDTFNSNTVAISKKRGSLRVEVNRNQMPGQFQPRIKSDIQTEYRELYGVTCLADNEMWTCGNGNKIKLYNLQGDVLKSVQLELRNRPWDIAVARNGDLLYSNFTGRSINVVKNEHTQILIALLGWKPLFLCCASSGDYLITMIRDDRKETKVVRYSGSEEKQSIQWDDNGEPLYSSGIFPMYKYLCENKNRDICVADRDAGAVVVVNAAGKLRFKYEGSVSVNKGLFRPRGITTDSHSRILTTDYDRNCIHIVDHGGHFLFCIDNCELQCPHGLCVDSEDNLFVTVSEKSGADEMTGKVKKIQYYK